MHLHSDLRERETLQIPKLQSQLRIDTGEPENGITDLYPDGMEGRFPGIQSLS